MTVFFFTLQLVCGIFYNQTTFPMVLSAVKRFGLLGARYEENHLKVKMAEKHLEAGKDGYVSFSLPLPRPIKQKFVLC